MQKHCRTYISEEEHHDHDRKARRVPWLVRYHVKTEKFDARHVQILKHDQQINNPHSKVVLPREVKSLPFVLQMKWSTDMHWPGRRLSWRKTPLLSRTAVVFVPFAGRQVCFPNWQAAHFGGCLILQAAVWRRRVASVWLNTPERNRAWTLLKEICPKRWCHRRSSFSGSLRFMFSSLTTETILFNAFEAASHPLYR